MARLYLDTETTGLGADAEIIEVALIDDDGRVLLDTLCDPGPDKWITDSARKVHGITDDMLEGQPPAAEIKLQVLDLVRGHEVIIFNADFDGQFFPGMGEVAKVRCAMVAFSELYGEWNDDFGDWRWQKLAVAAQRAGHIWRGPGHRAIQDAYAVRSVWQWCLENRPRIRAERIQQEADKGLREYEWRCRRAREGNTPAWAVALTAEVEHARQPGCVCRRCLRADADYAFGEPLRARRRARAAEKREEAYQFLLESLKAGAQVNFGIQWPTDRLMTTTQATKTLGAHPEAMGLNPKAWGVTNQHTGGLNPLWCRREVESRGKIR